MREDEAVGVTVVEHTGPSEEARLEARRGLEAYFAEVDARRKSASPEEADAIIDEALRSTRPNYRSIA